MARISASRFASDPKITVNILRLKKQYIKTITGISQYYKQSQRSRKRKLQTLYSLITIQGQRKPRKKECSTPETCSKIYENLRENPRFRNARFSLWKFRIFPWIILPVWIDRFFSTKITTKLYSQRQKKNPRKQGLSSQDSFILCGPELTRILLHQKIMKITRFCVLGSESLNCSIK